MDNKKPWYATTKAMVGGGIIAVLLIILAVYGFVNNKYANLDQNIQTSQSNISKESQRRVDLFNNLADAIQSYNKFEQDTYAKITEARGQAKGGDVAGAALAITAVVEAYPQLKSQENYKQAMTEFSITENRLAAYREQYNNDVRSFNFYVQSFPASPLLSIAGKDKTQKKYLDFKVNDAQARDLFK
jgi:LemA protein